MSDNPKLKDLCNRKTVQELADCLQTAHAGFPSKDFVKAACRGLDKLEFKDRIRHVGLEAGKRLPPDFKKTAGILRKAAGPDAPAQSGMVYWPLLQIVQERGLDHFEEAMKTMEVLTKRFSAEFAIRPYLDREPKEAVAWLQGWARDPDPAVRRLVSEGTRPRLPWAPRLERFGADPKTMLPLLETLKDDPDEVVRRSVANHLNDIAKDHPDLVVATIKPWLCGASADRLRLIRHALRTLVKKGHPGAMGLLGVGKPRVSVGKFAVSPKRAELGQGITISLELRSQAKRGQELIVDYAVHHRTARGGLGRKVYKWSRRKLEGGASLRLSKRHKLVTLSTRRYHPGEHRVELLVNGCSMAIESFQLRVPRTES